MVTPYFNFGNLVVVEKKKLGVVVRGWSLADGLNYDVYVRGVNKIVRYPEREIRHYLVPNVVDQYQEEKY